MNSLLDRFSQFRNEMPNADLWESLDNHKRGRLVLNLLDKYGESVGDTTIYLLFVKAHRIIFNGGIYVNMFFSHSKLIELLDLMEKYVKNWAFS